MEQQHDTIRIELIVEACIGFEDKVYMHGSVEIFINQRKPYDESSDIVEVETLIDSLEKDGEYKIFSCCCGVPECSGWYHGIEVRSNESEIHWTNKNTDENWTFEKASILEQLETIREQASFYKEFFEKKDIEYVGAGSNW